jgi:DNA-binding CsgD family transcriptional regulator
MDEKTEELRDIFMDVTDEETVTESQDDDRGSLLDGGDVRERLEEVIARMREEYEFSTDLTDDELCQVVAEYYEGESDAEIARELDIGRTTVQRARLDLHLVRDRDTDAPFDLASLRTALEEGEAGTGELADRFDVSPSTLRRYRRVVLAQGRARRANERYRAQFDDVLADADLSTRIAEGIQEDGLEEATEGLESDVQF